MPANLVITGNTTSGSAVVAGVAANPYLAVGQAVTGAGIPTGTTIASLSPFTLSANATATASNVSLTVAVTGWTALTASLIGSAGNLLTGTLLIQPTDANDTPINATAGGPGGQLLEEPWGIPITNGALPAGTLIPDSTLAYPTNVYFRLTFKNAKNRTVKTLTKVQPSGATLNLDTYQSPNTTQALQVAGIPGKSINFRGAWAANTAYAALDSYTNGGSLYVVATPYSSGGSFGSTDTANAVLSAAGATLTGSYSGPFSPASLAMGPLTLVTGGATTPLLAVTDEYSRTALTVGQDGTVTIPKAAVPFNGTTQPLSTTLATLSTASQGSALKQRLLAKVNSIYNGEFPTMASPPTFTLSAANATSTLSGTNYIAWNTTQWRTLYATAGQLSTNAILSFGSASYSTSTPTIGSNYLSNGCGVEFDHTGTKFELVLRGCGTRIRVYVDEQLATPFPSITFTGSVSSGTPNVVTGVSNAASALIGESAACSNFLPGATITNFSGSGNTITLSTPATTFGSVSVTSVQAGMAANNYIPADGQSYNLLIDFTGISSSAVKRRIRIVADSLQTFGLKLVTGESISYPTDAEPSVVKIMGDSYIEGLTGTLYPCNGMSFALGRRFGWNMHSAGVGGTGFFQPGSWGITFGQRVYDLTSVANLDLAIVMMTINDFGVPFYSIGGGGAVTVYTPWTGFPTTFAGVYSMTAATLTTFVNAFQAAKPGVPLIFAGPTWKDSSVIPNPMIAYRDAARDVAHRMPGVHFVEQYQQTLLTGTGNINNVQNDGNCDLYVNLDGVHPSSKGHIYRGYTLAQQILQVIENEIQ